MLIFLFLQFEFKIIQFLSQIENEIVARSHILSNLILCILIS